MASDRQTAVPIPLIPPKTGTWDLALAQTCSALVNVAVDMGRQWFFQVDATKTNPIATPSTFQWTPQDLCACSQQLKVLGGFEPLGLDDLIWSTFKTKDGVSHTEPFGFLATSLDGETAYLAFRGTQGIQGEDPKSWPDTRMDLETELTPYFPPGAPNSPSIGKVETGFYAVFQGMTVDLQQKLEQAKGKTLYLTGHSLGSTLSTLSVAWAAFYGFTGLHYPQASPKVGDQDFADWLGKSASRPSA